MNSPRTVRAVASILALAACARGSDAPTAVPEPAFVDTTMAVPAALTPLALATYDGSGEVVHPDFLTPVRPWSYRPRYLAATPYPNSDRALENPTLYSGADGLHWLVAPGTPNPVVRPHEGFLSDPDIVYANRRNEVFLYYRQNSDSDRIFLTRSRNGTNWSRPTQVVGGRWFTLLSPAVVRRSSSEWLMWSVNAIDGCIGPSAQLELRRSSDGIDWSSPVPLQIDLRGRWPWHVDVQWIPSRSEYWALIPTKEAGTCAPRELVLARSPDGVTWTRAVNPVARAGESYGFRDVVYRSTFAYDAAADAVTFWMSGARFTGDGFVWSTAAVRRPVASVLDPLRNSRFLRHGERRRLVDSLFVPPE